MSLIVHFYKNHESVALQTAREGIVLLKNDKNLLPLSKSRKNILVTGDYIEKIATGGGSANVKGFNNRILLDELRKEFGRRIIYAANPNADQIHSADVVLCAIGTEDHEGWDRAFELPEDQEKKVKDCVINNPNTVVVVSSGGGIRMTDWNSKARAILYAWYGGQIGSKALVEIIAGKVNPSGKLPITIEKEFKDSPGYGYIPKGEMLYQGWNEKEEKAHPVYDVRYDEGIFTGYRWYEKKSIEPLYPFGFGLSYSTFKYSKLSIKTDKFQKQGKVKVSFTLKNLGKRRGLETVQLYIQDVKCTVPRPIKELKGFAKLNLKPGQSRNIVMELTEKDFSFWNPKTKDWFFEKGTFVIQVGSSSKDIRIQKQIKL